MATFTNELPTTGYIDTYYGRFNGRVAVDLDQKGKPWFIVSIRHSYYGQEKDACGRGRSLEVAIKFAKQALKKSLEGR